MCKIPSNAIVSTMSGQIIAQNINRTGLFIRNMDAAKTIYIAFGHDAEIGKGISLQPKESFSMCREEYSSEAIFAIATGADVSVSIQEFDLNPPGA